MLDETDDGEITIGLIRLLKKLPDHEFFFQINRINSFCFERIEDLIVEGFYYTYHFPVFEGYCKESKTRYHFFSNKSSESFKKREITELFTDEQNIKFLLNNFQDVNYIVKNSDVFSDFSLILLPENLTTPIQDFSLSSENELYQMIQYYE